ncbi:hypothetical protein F0562_017770 [Nyssa sinensis]|uniref:Dirigent protein n=1 Tax=Nyssa sinensis TaxID=561372 RepID=A0A5J4ZJN7_9ASTE|nr:hypothetical protein F0562_017770 [Nyssa sinensis]
MGSSAMPLVIMVFSTVIAMALVHGSGIGEGPKEVEEWFQNLSHAKEKMTKLHFYFHDLTHGKGQTAAQMAQTNISSKSPTSFGFLNMMDDPLTVGPELSSKMVGRAQGFYGTDSMEEVTQIVAINFIFSGGEYNGSSLTVMGWNPILRVYREMPIVGGSGVFRLARGVVTFKTYFFNVTAGNATIEVAKG